MQLVRAGPGPLADQLFAQLGGYAAMNEASWGQALPYGQGSGGALSGLLRWLPVLLPLAGLRAWSAWRRGDAAELPDRQVALEERLLIDRKGHLVGLQRVQGIGADVEGGQGEPGEPAGIRDRSERL